MKSNKTSDGVNIAYDLYEVDSPKAYLVFVHMMPATKESWKDFAAKAQSEGYYGIAIDLRGHGNSDGGPSGYQNFSDEEHQKSMLDLQAAADLLKEKGATNDKIYFVGASIGANLSLQYLAENPGFRKAVLLSPGLNYRGIEALPLVKKLSVNESVMYVTSRDDDNNVEMTQELYNATPKLVKKELVVYETGGHGTSMFAAPGEPDLSEAILKFLKK